MGEQIMYGAAWRTDLDGGTQKWMSTNDHDLFKNTDTDYVYNRGLRMTFLDYGNDYYTAVWRPGSGDQHWWRGDDLDELKQKDTDYFNQGFRLVSLGSYTEIDDYFALWRPGTGAQHWDLASSAQELKDKDKVQFNKGRRLVAVGGGGDDWFACWRTGSGAQYWIPYWSSSDDFGQWDTKYLNMGLRLTVLNDHTAVWRPGTGSQHRVLHLHPDHFKQTDTAYYNQGYRLACIRVGWIVS